jgi:hypothetical protein
LKIEQGHAVRFANRSRYIQLTEVETVFRALKSDLAIRPIWHFTPKRV